MMDVQGCHLQIASVKMIDPSLQRGQLKFTTPNLKLALCASPGVTCTADEYDGSSTAVNASLTQTLAHVPELLAASALGRAVTVIAQHLLFWTCVYFYIQILITL